MLPNIHKFPVMVLPDFLSQKQKNLKVSGLTCVRIPADINIRQGQPQRRRQEHPKSVVVPAQLHTVDWSQPGLSLHITTNMGPES